MAHSANLIATSSVTGLVKTAPDILVPEERNQTSPRTAKEYLKKSESKELGALNTGANDLSPPSSKKKFIATSEEQQVQLEKNASKSALIKSKVTYSDPKGDVVHRNSVSARSSQTNLEDPKLVKKGSVGHHGYTLSRKNSASSQKMGSISEIKPGFLDKGVSESIQEIPEEGTYIKPLPKTTSVTHINGTKISSLSKSSSVISKEGFLKSKILSLSRKFKMGSSEPKKAKNVASSQVKMFNPPQAGNPSASAYDIRRESGKEVKTLDDYYVIRRVGKGGFATVFLVKLKASSGRYFALKAIKKTEVVRLKQEKQIMNEKNILLELKHHLLIDLYHTFQSPSNLFMVLEFVAGGDLFTQLRKSKVLIF